MSLPYGGIPPAEVVTTPPAVRRVSWPAIFAGIVLVLAIEILLNVLGVGVGLGLVNPGRGQAPNANGLGMGAGVWWFVSTIIALVLGCYAAARLADVPSRWDGALHGLVIWGGTVLITIYLLTSALGGIIGGAFSIFESTISAAASTVGSAIKTAAPKVEQSIGINPGTLQQQAEDMLQAPTSQDLASMSHPDAVKAIVQALPDLFSSGDKSAAAQKRITAIVAAQTHMSQQDAEKRVEDAKTKLTDLKNRASQTTGEAVERGAATGSDVSLVAFGALLVGAIAAAIGGSLATPRPRRIVGALVGGSSSPR